MTLLYARRRFENLIGSTQLLVLLLKRLDALVLAAHRRATLHAVTSLRSVQPRLVAIWRATNLPSDRTDSLPL
jgi:hypothetical protein